MRAWDVHSAGSGEETTGGSGEQTTGCTVRDLADRDDVVLATDLHGRMRSGQDGAGLSRTASPVGLEASLRGLGTGSAARGRNGSAAGWARSERTRASPTRR